MPATLHQGAMTMPEPELIDPDMGPDPDADPDADATAWNQEQGNVWVDGYGWMTPEDAAKEQSTD